MRFFIHTIKTLLCVACICMLAACAAGGPEVKAKGEMVVGGTVESGR